MYAFMLCEVLWASDEDGGAESKDGSELASQRVSLPPNASRSLLRNHIVSLSSWRKVFQRSI